MSVLKYKLNDGTWREVATIRGERGPRGEAGPAGPQGPEGPVSTVPGPQGPAGHTPTDAELTALITPIVQQQLGVIENGTY